MLQWLLHKIQGYLGIARDNATLDTEVSDSVSTLSSCSSLSETSDYQDDEDDSLNCLSVLETLADPLFCSGLYVIAQKNCRDSPTLLHIGSTTRLYHRLLYSFLTKPEYMFPLCFIMEKDSSRLQRIYMDIFQQNHTHECVAFARAVIRSYAHFPERVADPATCTIPTVPIKDVMSMLKPFHDVTIPAGIVYLCLWEQNGQYKVTTEESPLLCAFQSEEDCILLVFYVVSGIHDDLDCMVRGFRSKLGDEPLPYSVVLYNFFSLGLLDSPYSLDSYFENIE